MAMIYATITGTITRPGSNVGVRARITATPLTTNQALTFTGDDRITIGPETAETNGSGTLSTLKIPTNVDVGALLWRITAEALDRGPGPSRWTVKNAVAITGSSTIKLKDLVEVDVITVDAAIVTNVSALVADADSSKTAAAGSATAAAGSASAAATSASAAAGSATGASGSASAAATSASTASTKAGEASGSATAAAGSASAAAASASHADAMAGAAEAVAVSNDTIIAGRINDSASATATALTASTAQVAVSRWKSGAAYSVGQPVYDPLGGSIMLVATAHTAGVDFDVTKFIPALGQPCNLLTYGCKGDDATNDTTAFVAAATAADTLGKWVYAPKGTFRVSNAQVPVPATLTGLIIQGAGIGRTIFKNYSGATPMFKIGDGGSLDAQHVAMYDLTVDGNNVASEAIRLNKTRFFTMHRAILQNFTTYNVNTMGGSGIPNYFADFTDVRFRSTPINVYIDGAANEGGNSNYFTRCHFSGSSNVNYNGAGVAINVVINGGDSNIFRDCEFSDVGATAFYLHNAAIGNKILANQFDGPAVAVNCASVGVSRTHILDNTGTVVIVDSGTSTVIRQDYTLSGGSQGVMIGGSLALANVTPLRVRQHATNSSDAFRVEKSDASTLFRVDPVGNIETGPLGALTAHALCSFNNDNNNSISVRVRTGPTSSSSQGNKGLVVQAMNSGHTANLVEIQDSAGTAMMAIGPKGSVKLAKFATASRPSASTAGEGAVIYDDDLNLPIFSDGTNWKNFAGTTV